MASTKDFVEYICEHIANWKPEYKKMFGEYMIYINSKPIFLVCDNTVYVKQFAPVAEIIGDAEKGFPYSGAKEHFVIDIDNLSLVEQLIPVLLDLVPIPKKKLSKQKVK